MKQAGESRSQGYIERESRCGSPVTQKIHLKTSLAKNTMKGKLHERVIKRIWKYKVGLIGQKWRQKYLKWALPSCILVSSCFGTRPPDGRKAQLSAAMLVSSNYSVTCQNKAFFACLISHLLTCTVMEWNQSWRSCDLVVTYCRVVLLQIQRSESLFNFSRSVFLFSNKFKFANITARYETVWHQIGIA